MKKRIALIIESSHRPETPMPAYEFYKGPYSNWIKSVMEYLEMQQFDKGNIFFLSYQNQRVIPYEEKVYPYPKRETGISKKESESFAKKILAFVQRFPERIFVEIHAGKDISVPLAKLFRAHGVESRVYADGVPLGQKPSYYKQLMVEHEKMEELKGRNNYKKFSLLSLIKDKTIYEAKLVAESLESKAASLGVETEFEKLKYLLKKHYQRQKDVFKVKDEFEKLFKKEGEPQELLQFLEGLSSEYELFEQPERYGSLKKKYGKVLAKFQTFLIKGDILCETERNISSQLVKLQVTMRNFVINSL